ncbi:MAG: hypothetical protein ACLQVI_22095 [Polyangiaceae bacterium]
MSAKKKPAPKRRATTREPILFDRPREDESDDAAALRIGDSLVEALTDFLVAEVLRQRAKANRDRLALIIEQARRDNPNLTEAQLMAQVGALKVIFGADLTDL